MFPWHMTKLKPESPRSILLHLGVLFIVLDSSDVEDVIASVVDEGSGMIEGERKDIVGMRKDVEVRENSNIEGFRIVKKRKQHMISLCAGDIDEKQHPFREAEGIRIIPSLNNHGLIAFSPSCPSDNRSGRQTHTE
jgi:hypothetical protein